MQINTQEGVKLTNDSDIFIFTHPHKITENLSRMFLTLIRKFARVSQLKKNV